MNKMYILNTFHELGNFLTELAEQIKNSPDEELEYTIRISKKKKRKTLSKLSKPGISENIDDLALQIKNLSRDEAETKLINLSSKELIRLCKNLSISTSGKKKKDEIINRILSSLFDTVEGHRLIRNFSQSSD